MPIVTIKGAAEYTGLTEHRIRTLAKQKKIPHMKSGVKYLFRTETLYEWMKEQEELSVKDNNGEEQKRL